MRTHLLQGLPGRTLVLLHFEGIVLFPQRHHAARRDFDSLLVGLPQRIDFLQVLPSRTAGHTWARLDEVDVVSPQVRRVWVVADRADYVLEGGGDGGAVYTLRIRDEREDAAEIGEVFGPQW